MTTHDDDGRQRLLMPEVQRGLTTAVRGATGERGTRRRRPARIGGIALAAVLCSGTALAATTDWNPFASGSADAPTIAATAPPSDQAAALGVLRRAQTDADRSPAITSAIARLRGHDVGGVHTDDVRLLTSGADGVTFVVPVARTGSSDTPIRQDQLCLVQATPAHEVAGRPVDAGTAYRCGDISDIRAGKLISGAQYGGHLQLVGLVPDGVASVEVPLKGGPPITARVSDNGFAIDESDVQGTFDRYAMRWLDADGHAIPIAQ
ncbi:MAG: hypothetical protein JWM93_2303 [Frankiales bacterium]|nr:hypothetical protein [Frankiales bacterium]